MTPEQTSMMEQIYKDVFSRLELDAYRSLKSRSDARVAAQETFRIACEKIGVFSVHPNQVGWLKRTLNHVCTNMFRARKRGMEMLTSLDGMTDAKMPYSVDPPSFDPLEEYKGIVPDEDLDLFRRIVLEQESYIDMAEELGIKMWTCRKRVQRITKKLREGRPREDAKNFLKS